VVGSRELAGAVARRVADAQLAEVLEVRRALEVEAARSAARRRTDHDLAELDAALEAREVAWANGEVDEFVAADVELHQRIVAAAHNRILAELYLDFSAALRASITIAIGDDLTPERYVDHSRLVEAIRGGDPEQAALEAAAFLEQPQP
jgi:DNA-binding FadR family transcriptional regulator